MSATEVMRLQESSSKKEGAVSDLQKNLREARDECESLTSRIKDLESQHQENIEKNEAVFEEKLSSAAKSIKNLEKDLESSRKELNIKQSNWEEKQNEAAKEFDSELSKLNKTVEGKSARISELESKIKSSLQTHLNTVQ